ncbi:MAG: alpha/beta fold hydrolase [Kofleriaceae bacterium]
MPRAQLLQIVAFAVLGVVGACTAPSSESSRRSTIPRDEGVEGDPFARDEDFEPEAFGVKVIGSGPPMILIPGIACPGEVWDEMAEHYKDDYESHVITLSGFAGREPIDEPISAAVRRDLARYIRAKKLDKPIIVGHSMGGFIAYWMAAYHPALIGPVIIVDASPALSGDIDAARYLRDRWKQLTDAELVARIRGKFMGMTKFPNKMRPIIKLIEKSDRRTIGNAVFEMMTTNLLPQVKQIQSPVLIVAADGGYQHRIRAQTAGIPTHRMVVLPRTRHFVMWDDPPAFYKVVDAFLAEHLGEREEGDDPDAGDDEEADESAE